jgi:predicted MFS family arabinose efflux permease
MLMMFLAPVLPAIGWRNLWLANGALAATLAALWWTKTGAMGTAPPVPGVSVRRVMDVLGNVRCRAAALAFFAYSCQIFSLLFALPQYLMSAYAMPLGNAGLLSGAVLAVATVGHIASGYVLRAGLSLWACIATALMTFAALGLVFYSAALPAPAAVLLAAIALGIGGLAPGALYASAPHIAPAAGDVPVTIGLLQQASNLGQFAGPLMVGALVAHFGWQSAAFVMAPIAVAGAWACLYLRGAEGKADRGAGFSLLSRWRATGQS